MNDRRWPLLLGVPLAAAVFAGASSPWIAQRTPRSFFPTLAVAGGALFSLAFGRAVARAVRQYRTGARVPALSLLINALAVVVIVGLPLTRVVRMITAPAGGPPRILVGFGDWLGGEGYPRPSPHRGLDIAGRPGADVLAVADGRVTVARDNRDLCGLIVVIAHDPHEYRTVYCHLSEISVQPGEHVTPGRRIGALGTTGQRAWPGYEHVHLELQRGGDPNAVEDPLPRLVASSPIRCSARLRD